MLGEKKLKKKRFLFYFNYLLLFPKKLLLGSKDLGIYVFRTLMCIVGKP